MHTFALISDIALSNSCWYDAFHVHVVLLDVSFLSGLYTSNVSGRICQGN